MGVDWEKNDNIIPDIPPDKTWKLAMQDFQEAPRMYMFPLSLPGWNWEFLSQGQSTKKKMIAANANFHS